MIATIVLGLLAIEPLKPAPLWSFNGKAWSGLRIGEQTDSDLKKMFGAGKGAVRPEALQIPTSDEGIRVDGLLNGRGSSAKLTAIRVRYEAVAPPSVKELTEVLGEEPEWYWHRERAGKWAMAIWPKSGIISICEDIGGEFRPDFFLLLSTDNTWAITQDFLREETDLIVVPDPGRNWDRRLAYNNYSVSVTGSGRAPDGCGPQDRKRMEDWAEDELHHIRTSDLGYDLQGRGSVTLTANWSGFNDRDEGKLNMTATYSGQTPYGRVTFSSYSNTTVRRNYRREFEYLVTDLLDDLIRVGRRKADTLEPPTTQEWYDWQMRQLYDRATGTNSAGSPLDGRKN